MLRHAEAGSMQNNVHTSTQSSTCVCRTPGVERVGLVLQLLRFQAGQPPQRQVEHALRLLARHAVQRAQLGGSRGAVVCRSDGGHHLEGASTISTDATHVRHMIAELHSWHVKAAGVTARPLTQNMLLALSRWFMANRKPCTRCSRACARCRSRSARFRTTSHLFTRKFSFVVDFQGGVHCMQKI